MSNAIRTLNLVQSNVDLYRAGHAVFNAGIRDCLSMGLVEYCPSRRIGYVLTRKGKAVLTSGAE